MACEYSPQISIVDMVVSAVLVTVFVVMGSQKKKNLEAEKPYYSYYINGLLFKLFAVIGFLCIFIYYYQGGDTLAYHEGAVAMKNLFYESPGHYFDLLLRPIAWEKYYNYFNGETCFPPGWMFKKESNFMVIRIASIPQLFLANMVLAPTLVVARVAYGAIFKLYGMFCEYFPGREKALAYAFLFMPSVAFWGSGIMKDTIALTGICWFVVLFNRLVIQRRFNRSLFDLAGIALAMFAIFMVKTYLLLALLPGLAIWTSFQWIVSIRSRFVKVVLFPLLMGGFFMGLTLFYTANADLFGVYGADTVLEEAAKVQQDLVRDEAYGKNRFDIGKFDATPAGIVAKVPDALLAGLFRPFIWESGGSPTMVFAGIENAVLLILFAWVLVRTGFFGFFRTVFASPLLILGFIFTLLLAFSIGLTSANFGALVRYKVPLVPFFMSILLLAFPSKRKA